MAIFVLFNDNNGCIEIVSLSLDLATKVEFNDNNGCIEILKRL